MRAESQVLIFHCRTSIGGGQYESCQENHSESSCGCGQTLLAQRLVCVYVFVLVTQHLTLCDPHKLQPTKLLCPWNSPKRNTGVGCHFLLHRGFCGCGQTLPAQRLGEGSGGGQRGLPWQPGHPHYLMASNVLKALLGLPHYDYL